MKVICAGFPQTGTASLSDALRALGYKVYGYDEHVSLHMDTWIAAMKGSKKRLNFKSMYRGIDAVYGAPPCLYFQQLMKAFPTAKVILTVRDSDEHWLKSCRDQIHPRYTASFCGLKRFIYEQIPRYLLLKLSPTMQTYVHQLETPLYKEILGTQHFDDGELMKWTYREHNERVKFSVPCKKLLVLNVNDGWQPLCEFLGRSIPDKPFPHKNDDCSLAYQVLYVFSVGRKSFREAFRSLSLFLLFAFFIVLMAIMFN